MKNLIFTISVLLSTFCYSQFNKVENSIIEIGVNNKNTRSWVLSKDTSNNSYFLLVANSGLGTYGEATDDMLIIMNENELKQLIGILKNGYSEIPEAPQEYEFSTYRLSFKFIKVMGIRQVQLHYTNFKPIVEGAVSEYLTERNFKNLFKEFLQ